jgi:hypothetical protein
LLATVTNIGRLAQLGALSLLKVGACLKALGPIARVTRFSKRELARVAQIAVVLAILADNARIVPSGLLELDMGANLFGNGCRVFL